MKHASIWLLPVFACLALRTMRCFAEITCDNGCNVADYKANDGWCDCEDCSDEAVWTCETCPGCPDECGSMGGGIQCLGTTPTPTRVTPEVSARPITGVPTALPTERPQPFDRLLALSFIVAPSDMEASSDECLAAVAVNGTEYTAPASTPCSLADAMDLCSQMTAAGAFEAVANEWALEGSFGNASADGCEFLFYTESVDDEFEVMSAGVLEVLDAVDFEAALYPWQYSYNSQLLSELHAAGGVRLPLARINANSSVLRYDGEFAEALLLSVYIYGLELAATGELQSPLFYVANGAANVQLSQVWMREFTLTNTAVFWFDAINDVTLDNCDFEYIWTFVETPLFYFNSLNKLKMHATDVAHMYSARAPVIKAVSVKVMEVSLCDFSYNVSPAEDYWESRVINYEAIGGSFLFVDNSCIDSESGCLKVTEAKNVTVANSYFAQNHAKDGGALFVQWYTYAEVDWCVFEENSATNSGGAVFMDPIPGNNSRTMIRNSSFRRNRGYYGGALYTSSVEVFNTTLSGNLANGNGGAIYFITEATVRNCVIVENESVLHGGGIFAHGHTSANFGFFDSFCSGNRATLDGGCVYTERNALLERCHVSRNSARFGGGFRFGRLSASGGAMDGILMTNMTFEENTAHYDGGAIHIWSITTRLTRCKLLRNEAAFVGGAAYIEGFAWLFLTEVVAIGNVAAVGGGLGSNERCTVRMEDSEWRNNEAVRGGAIYMVNDAVFHSKRTIYEDNVAILGGALMFKPKNAWISLELNRFKNNEATEGAHIFADTVLNLGADGVEFSGGRSSHGAVFVTDSTSNFIDCNFTDNSAKEEGAAVMMQSGNILLATRCLFARNDAPIAGAIFVVDSVNADITLENCEFSSNVADTKGAVLATRRNVNNTFSVTETKFANNSVPNGVGGAFALSDDSRNTLLLSKCTFEDNFAQGYSGALYVDCALSTVRVADSRFARNDAGDFNASAMFIEATKDVTIENCLFENGEEVFVRSAQRVVISDNEFAANTGVTLLNTDSAQFEEVVFEGNALNESAQLRSFPVSLRLAVVKNSAAANETCPGCALTVAVSGVDLFSSTYSALSWCDLEKTCFDVSLQWALDILSLMEAETDSGIYSGSGQLEFWLSALRRDALLNLSLLCSPPDDVQHVCSFEDMLTVPLRVGGCRGNSYAKQVDGGRFQCAPIASLSSDKYSYLMKSAVWPTLISAAAICALLTLLFFLKERRVLDCAVPCFRKRVDGASVYALAIFAWHCFDFLTDANLSQSLFQVWHNSERRDFHEATNWQWLSLAIASLLFVVVPFAANLYFTWNLPKELRSAAPTNQCAAEYVKEKGKFLSFCCLWSGNLYASLFLANSRLLALDRFYLGLTKPQLRHFVKFRVLNVWMENVPQLIVQMLVLVKDSNDGDNSKVAFTVLLSFASSLVSAAAILFEYVYAKDAAADSLEDFEVRIKSEGIEMTTLSRGDRLRFQKNAHLFRAVRRVVAEALDVEGAQLHLGHVSLKGHGCVVYGQIPSRILAETDIGRVDTECCRILWQRVFKAESVVSGEMCLLSSADGMLKRVGSLSSGGAYEPFEGGLALGSGVSVPRLAQCLDDSEKVVLQQWLSRLSSTQASDVATSEGEPKTTAIPVDVEMAEL